MKSLLQRAIKKISLELREVFISRSKLSVSLLQWHRQCNDLSSHRSIYQWIDSPISSRATSESASMTSFVNAMIYLLIALFINESIRLSVHVQLVSLLQWHLFSMQWSIFSSFYSSVNLIIHSHATSESATMTSFVNAMIYWDRV